MGPVGPSRDTRTLAGLAVGLKWGRIYTLLGHGCRSLMQEVPMTLSRPLVVTTSLVLLSSLHASAETLRVRAETADIRATPDRGSALVAALPKGTLVEIIERAGVWIRVVQPEQGLEGYAFAAMLEPVASAPPARAPVEATREAATPEWRRGDMLLGQGRYADAIVAYHEWLRTHDGDAAAHHRLGTCFQRTGHTKDARREYERALKIESCYAEAWNNLGTLAHVRGKPKEAVSAYTRAVQCRPERAAFHQNLGAAYMDLGDLVQSARAYAEAIRLDPAVLDTTSGQTVAINRTAAAKRYIALAKYFAIRGELDAAVKFLARARACDYAHFTHAVATEHAFAELLRTPRYAEQIKEFLRVYGH